jgi:hypothetical protein
MAAGLKLIRLTQNQDGNKMNNNTQSNANKNDEMREFMLVVRQALKIIVAWIERRYIADASAGK